MSKIDYRPASGGGSCPRCRDSLSLASVKVDGVWYCGSSCAQGRLSATARSVSVPEPRLYGRPQRFFLKRRPQELNSSRR